MDITSTLTGLLTDIGTNGLATATVAAGVIGVGIALGFMFKAKRT